MGRTIGLAIALCLNFIALVTIHYPSSPLFWVASTTIAFNILRCSVSLVLLMVYMHTPKKRFVRELLALAALLFAGWIWLGAHMEPVDIFSLSAAAVALLLILLESKPADEPFKSMELGAAIRDLVADKLRVFGSWLLQLTWLIITDVGIKLNEHGTSSSKT